jgi:hypothetical protein
MLPGYRTGCIPDFRGISGYAARDIPENHQLMPYKINLAPAYIILPVTGPHTSDASKYLLNGFGASGTGLLCR